MARAVGSSKILVWQVIVNLQNLSQILMWQGLVNLTNIGVAAAIPATLVPTALKMNVVPLVKSTIQIGFL